MKELRNYIRKLLEESLDEQVLEEDFDSVKEIKELANETLIHLAKLNIDYILRQVEEGKVHHLYQTTLLNVYQDNPKKFPTLSNFLTNSRIYVNISRKTQDEVLGHYTHIKEPEYDREALRNITLFPKVNFYDKLTQDALKDKEHDYKDTYFTFWYAFHSTLEHEIQHAYDDFRSNSKLFQSKPTKQYLDKHTLPNGKEVNYTNAEERTKKYREYLNLQHEVWARFTQAVNETRFIKGDFAISPEGIDYLKYEMKPLDVVIKDFKIEFDGWRILPDAMKKRLLARVSAYWHKEMENLDKTNEKSIEREKEALKKYQVAEVRKAVRQTLLESLDGMAEYKKWKRNNVMVRGISSDGTLDVANGSGARFGDGLYMAPLSNKSMAKNYGKVYFVVNGKPKNPKVFKDTNLAEIWIQQNLIFNKYKNAREFNAATSIKDEMLKLGHDGIEIKGRETVNFAPENIQYFSTENGLIDYYERVIENKMIDENLNEDYPSSFNMDAFKTLKTFKDRVAYCNANLKKLGSGSSRIVYQIDDQKVLKLAKNNKGIVQNETEIDRGTDSYFSHILAQVFDSEDNGLWVEMERAIPINKHEFLRYTNFTPEEIKDYLRDFQSTNSGQKSYYRPSPELKNRLDNDEFVQYLREFIAGTDALAGDLGQPTSYGLVKRNGQQELVLIDFGLTDTDYNKLYREGEEPLDESNNTNLWIYGGIVLVKGKPLPDNTHPLYAFHIVDLKELGRTKVDNTPGKSAKMVILDNNLFRIVVQDGQLRALKVDFRQAASLSRTLNFNGRQSHAVTLNNNKTPLHWETLKYNNFPQLFKSVGMEIMNLPNIKLSL